MSQSRFQVRHYINKVIVYIQAGEKHYLDRVSDFIRVSQNAVADI